MSNGINFDSEFLIFWCYKVMTIKHGNLDGCLIGGVRNKNTKKTHKKRQNTC